MENPFSRPILLFSLLVFLSAALPCPADSPSPREFAGATPLQWWMRLANAEIARRGDSLVWKPGGTAKWDYTVGLFALSLLKLDGQADSPEYVKFAEKHHRFVHHTGWRHPRLQSGGISCSMPSIPAKRCLPSGKSPMMSAIKRPPRCSAGQLDTQPRTTDGGFWHKQRYPRQMWLDGLYMGAPFYAEYAKLFNGPVTDYGRRGEKSKSNWRRRTRTIRRRGLFYHGWDESKEQPWANKATGTSSNFWGRAIGWYAMALVDVLDLFPDEPPGPPGNHRHLSETLRGRAEISGPEDRAVVPGAGPGRGGRKGPGARSGAWPQASAKSPGWKEQSGGAGRSREARQSSASPTYW